MPESKRLVVDASVARAAGGRENPTSKNCTDFLEILREVNHRLVMSPDIYAEWRNHESRFSSTWRTSMIARKKVVFLRQDQLADQSLREKLDGLNLSDTNRREMLKDAHLLEAALLTDQIISSLNSRDRKRFADVCSIVNQIRNILWVNPDKPDEKTLDWLREGAPADKERMLGFQPE